MDRDSLPGDNRLPVMPTARPGRVSSQAQAQFCPLRPDRRGRFEQWLVLWKAGINWILQFERTELDAALRVLADAEAASWTPYAMLR